MTSEIRELKWWAVFVALLTLGTCLGEVQNCRGETCYNPAHMKLPVRPCYIFNDAPALELGDVYRGGPGCTWVGNNAPYSIECEPEQLVCED